MAVPRQRTDTILEIVRGWDYIKHLQIIGKLDATVVGGGVTGTPVGAGTCMHLSDVGVFKLGTPVRAANATLIYMPIFLYTNSDDFVAGIEGGITGASNDAIGGFANAIPNGNLTGIPGCAGVELESTNFAAGSYPPNTSLMSDPGVGSAATHGQLKAGIPYTNDIVGIVSRGLVQPVAEGVRMKQRLAFWPYALPKFNGASNP